MKSKFATYLEIVLNRIADGKDGNKVVLNFGQFYTIILLKNGIITQAFAKSCHVLKPFTTDENEHIVLESSALDFIEMEDEIWDKEVKKNKRFGGWCGKELFMAKYHEVKSLYRIDPSEHKGVVYKCVYSFGKDPQGDEWQLISQWLKQDDYEDKIVTKHMTTQEWERSRLLNVAQILLISPNNWLNHSKYIKKQVAQYEKSNRTRARGQDETGKFGKLFTPSNSSQLTMKYIFGSFNSEDKTFDIVTSEDEIDKNVKKCPTSKKNSNKTGKSKKSKSSDNNNNNTNNSNNSSNSSNSSGKSSGSGSGSGGRRPGRSGGNGGDKGKGNGNNDKKDDKKVKKGNKKGKNEKKSGKKTVEKEKSVKKTNKNKNETTTPSKSKTKSKTKATTKSTTKSKTKSTTKKSGTRISRKRKAPSDLNFEEIEQSEFADRKKEKVKSRRATVCTDLFMFALWSFTYFKSALTFLRCMRLLFIYVVNK